MLLIHLVYLEVRGVNCPDGFLYGSVQTSGNCYSTGNIGTGTSTNNHTLTTSEIPKHQHYIHGYADVSYPNFTLCTGQGGSELAASYNSGGTNSHYTSYVGSGGGHNHGIPYIAAAIWRRTA
jgi:microcystin-dependent protein